MNFTIVSKLIEMGKAANLDDPKILEDFADLKDKGEEVLYGISRDITGGLTTEDLTALVKAMTIAEDRWRWIGGSVSPIIRVFEELEKRDSDLSNQVAEWIVRRSKNMYVPFRIIGCPHEEEIDYPEGESCPKCPFWSNRDRWSGELIH